MSKGQTSTYMVGVSGLSAWNHGCRSDAAPALAGSRWNQRPGRGPPGM